MGFEFAEHHLFTIFKKHILFNVETMLFYEVTPVIRDMVVLLESDPSIDPVAELTGRYTQQEIQTAAMYLQKEKFIRDSKPVPQPRLIRRYGMRHLELMVTHDCNMRCLYCYGASPAHGTEKSPYLFGAFTRGMSLETAKSGVDYLLKHAGKQKNLSVTFFGGEPLLEFDLIRNIVPYIRQRETDTGKHISLSLSTNGLLLTDDVVAFLQKNRIGCQVSMDGTPDLHDRNRRLQGDLPSYEKILPGIQKLLSIRKNRTPARATVSHKTANLPEIVEHLIRLGFGSVHIEPCIASNGNLSIQDEDVKTIQEQNETLSQFLVKSVQNGRFVNYTNLVRFIRHTRVIRDRLAYHCGAGRTYFALSQDGAFFPCHRFVGMPDYQMGDLTQGMDPTLQKKILSLTVDNRPGCRDCWARYMCGGGCWKHAVEMNGCLEKPDEQFTCKLTRHLIECAMAINSELKMQDMDILSDLYEKDAEPYLVEK